MKYRVQFVLPLLTALFFALLPISPAKADLTITPTRIVFNDRDRAATVDLLNITDHTNTYRFAWQLMRMEKGHFILVPDDKGDDPHDVSNMVIFTPRQVTIAPHGHQTVRLSLRRPADLPPGEYRAHLVMTRLAPGDMLRTQNPNLKAPQTALNVNLGFSIPVIVRSGQDPDLKVSLTGPKLTMAGMASNPKPALDITIRRDAGKFSTYGHFEVYWKSPDQGEHQIGRLGNIALYPETETRQVQITLQANPIGGTLRVVYVGDAEYDGTTLADQTFPLGK